MAGFKTHITVSTTLGIAYGAGAWYFFNVPAPAALLATGLCSVSGMLPDIDSNSGVPFRESMAFAAAVIPMLMMERFVALGWSHETMALVGGFIYLFVRFGIGNFLKNYTVHRGMFHSIPAAIVAGQVAFLVCSCEDLGLRYYKSFAVVLGYMSHLLLDEIYSLEMVRGRIRFKKSFGTATKFWGHRCLWANVSTYAKMIFLSYIVLQDPIWMSQVDADQDSGHRHHVATQPSAAERPSESTWR